MVIKDLRVQHGFHLVSEIIVKRRLRTTASR